MSSSAVNHLLFGLAFGLAFALVFALMTIIRLSLISHILGIG